MKPFESTLVVLFGGLYKIHMVMQSKLAECMQDRIGLWHEIVLYQGGPKNTTHENCIKFYKDPVHFKHFAGFKL